jgi:hypothetical protein
VSDRYAWWPANPAAAVAAICVLPGGLALQVAHELLAVRMGDTAEDDHAAALGLIERHIAYFSGQSSIPDDINGSEP